ncbi:MAG: hypothetical protein Q8N30_14225 [Methylococcales bacterium]|nr:hypothetical protein [Methylococcales bacterium]
MIKLDLLLANNSFVASRKKPRIPQAPCRLLANAVYFKATGGGAKILDRFSSEWEVTLPAEELGQCQPAAVGWTGFYLKPGKRLSGQWGSL